MFDIVINGGWLLLVHYVVLFIAGSALAYLKIEALIQMDVRLALWLHRAMKLVAFLNTFVLFWIIMWILGISFIA